MKSLKLNFIVIIRFVFTLLISYSLIPGLNAQINPENKRTISERYERAVPLKQIIEQQIQTAKNNDPGMERCRCIESIVQNGDFSEGSEIGGNIPYQASVTNWNTGTNTPQYRPEMGYGSPGFLYLWGNQVVSESVWQKVYFEKGKKYKGCFAFKYTYSHKDNPSKHIRFKLLASKIEPLNTPQCPDGNCTIITTSQTIVQSDGWQVHSFENWIADDDYYFLYITPENDEITNGAEYISHGFFDALCIEDDPYLTCKELLEYTNFSLTSSSTEGNLITNLVFEPDNTIPYGISHWWQIYEAENCDDDNFVILNEYSDEGDNPLREASGAGTFVVESPNPNFPDNNIELNRCYIVKHGLYYWNGQGCKWVERRAKLRVSFSSAQKSKALVELIPQKSLR